MQLAKRKASKGKKSIYWRKSPGKKDALLFLLWPKKLSHYTMCTMYIVLQWDVSKGLFKKSPRARSQNGPKI